VCTVGIWCMHNYLPPLPIVLPIASVWKPAASVSTKFIVVSVCTPKKIFRFFFADFGGKMQEATRSFHLLFHRCQYAYYECSASFFSAATCTQSGFHSLTEKMSDLETFRWLAECGAACCAVPCGEVLCRVLCGNCTIGVVRVWC